jgi:hypothetical protein
METQNKWNVTVQAYNTWCRPTIHGTEIAHKFYCKPEGARENNLDRHV